MDIWKQILKDCDVYSKSEPILTAFLNQTVLSHNSLEDALSSHLSNKLDSLTISAEEIKKVIDKAINKEPNIIKAVNCDLNAIVDRDPATDSPLIPFLYYKGFHALQSYRVAHWLWKNEQKGLALYFQNRISEAFGVDIHPAAVIGCGILMDHATSIVIGETAVIENKVSILHEVTLGGTGKETGDRHPKVREGVLIGAGAKILGNIEIGKGSKVGAGSVVLDAVPEHCTVVGNPAKVVGKAKFDNPALFMDHHLPEDGEC